MAECRIRNVLCTVEPLWIEFNRIETGSWRRPELPLLPILLVVVIVIMSIVMVILFIWKFKHVLNFVTKWHHSFSNKILLGGHPEEIQPLHDMGSLDSDIIRNQVQILMRYLQPEDFIGRLMSRGVSTVEVEEYNMLLQEQQNQEKLIKFLTRIVNTKSKSNSLLAMVIECDPNFHCVSSEVADFIGQNMSILVECLDVDNGLADCLRSREVLTSEQYEKLSNKTRWDSYKEQNRELLTNMLPTRLESEHMCKMFLAALVETDQRHIFNFIHKSLDDVQEQEDDHRILTVELNRIDRNLFHLVNSIDPSPTFLDSLLRESCIIEQHRDRINAQQTKREKNRELLTIIRRRSYEDFETFKRVTQETQKNGILIVKLLEQDHGHVISVHCEINVEPDAMMSSEHTAELETEISSHLTDATILSQSMTQEVSSGLSGMHEVGIDMIGATPSGSVIVFFSCQTFQSIVAFKQMVLNGELTRILEVLFNRIIGLSAIFRVRLIVSLSESEYWSCIEEARRTIYSKIKSHNQQLESECYVRHMPGELLELILLKSMVGIMSVEWRSNVADIKSVSGSYNLYETLSNKTWMSAYISLKSVTYQWMRVRCMNRGVALKEFVLRRLHEHYNIFSEQLNCRYVLLDCLQEGGIITDEERRNIMEAGDDVATKTYEDIPELYWPQMRDSEQMLISNKKLLKYLFEKNYSQISEFLKLLNDICLTHMLNHFIDSEASRSFGDVCPLSYARRVNIIECGTAMVTSMDIFLLPGDREKMTETGRAFRKQIMSYSSAFDGRIEFSSSCLTPEKKLSKLSNEKNLIYSRIDEFDRHREVNPNRQNLAIATINELKDHREGNPDRQNLIDLLYTEGCISLYHKQHIEQQPTQQLQNLVMLQLIKNGSIRTYKVALEYFRSTNEFEVYNMLNRKYISEEIQSSEWIEGIPMESRIVAAWLENRIYVISMESDIVQVFQDGLEIECIDLEGMTDPRDITTSQLTGAVFISDYDNRCIWTIQMPGERITRWAVDGMPYNMSVSSSDVLIVCVYRGNRFYLDLYRSSEFLLMESILLPAVQYLYHAVQLLNENFPISYSNADELGSCLISELSSDGNIIVRTLDPRTLKLNPSYHWLPYYISVDEDENIFIADYENDRIVLLPSSWTDLQILLNNEQHGIISPWRLCYVREKQQMIVTQGKSNRSRQGVCVFDLRSHTPHPIDRRTIEYELDLIKSSLSETTQMNTEMFEGWNPMHILPDLQLIKRFEIIAEECSVVGVTWLEDKIYAVCRWSNIVHAFQDREPFDAVEEGIIIKEMTDPCDISASEVRRSTFISDNYNRCLWKVHTSDGTISKWEMEGRPETLSITPSDELLVVVDREDHHALIIFRCLDVNRSQSIPLPTDVKYIAHAVQSSNGNIFMAYSNKKFPNVFLISELSSDGKNFIRTFDPRSVRSLNMNSWQPDHMSFDGNGNLFVVDFYRNKIHLLNSELSDLQNLLKTFQSISFGQCRLCYVQKRQQLIVGHADFVSLFNLL